MRLSGALNESALELAVRDVLARHESLRTLLVDAAASRARSIRSVRSVLAPSPDEEPQPPGTQAATSPHVYGGAPGNANLRIGVVSVQFPSEVANGPSRVPGDRDEEPQQIVLPVAELASPLRVVECSPDALTDELAAATARGFDLANEIPFRATLFRLGPDDHALLLLAPPQRRRRLVDRSAARRLWPKPTPRGCKGEAPAFTPLAVQYADYTLWQRALLGNENDPASPLARQIAYWTEKLADLPAELALPTDRPRPLHPELCRRRCRHCHPARTARQAPGPRPRAGRHAVHAAAGRARRLAQQARRRHRHPHRRSHRRTDRSRARPRSSASSSTRWCCAPTPAAIPLLPNCSSAPAPPAWRPTPTRTCPSSAWWRSSIRRARFGRQPLFQTMLVLQNNRQPQSRSAGGERGRAAPPAPAPPSST